MAQALDFLAPLKTSKRGQAAHAAIRSVCPTMEKDRVMYKDFARIAELIASGKLAEAACGSSPPLGVLEMKTLTEYLKFHTKTHRAYVHITPQVEQIVGKSGVQEGMVLVSAMHITAGVYVNDNESGLIEDIDQWLEHLAPFRKDYKHHETGEDNGDSHLKALLIHHEVIVPITAGKLDLGTWQRIFYAEFDGQRDKRVIVKVMGE